MTKDIKANDIIMTDRYVDSWKPNICLDIKIKVFKLITDM